MVADCISRVKQNVITFYNLIVLFYFLCFQVNISKKQQIIKTCKKTFVCHLFSYLNAAEVMAGLLK